MEFGPRALGNRSILGDPRSREDADDAESEGQISRKFPPLRAGRLARGRRRLVRLDGDSPYMLLVADVAENGGRRMSRRGRRRCSASTSSMRAALRHPGGDPCRLFGARADRASRDQPALPRADFGLQGQDRLPGAGQHQLQRARRADRLHARRTLSAASWAPRSRCWSSAIAFCVRSGRIRR